ncbi:MAG: hypothetical protein A2Z45_05585 [Chloroflexi bacterium RBG_19FT_COMBO_55_16]|nr:MAG: hypothetical protein A2Z45_05585 [Chloroflexi bacterium RBG_19FT_COMBO_55_16]
MATKASLLWTNLVRTTVWRKRLVAHTYGRTLIVGLVLFVIFIALLAQVQFSTPNLASTDDYYHIKFASLMRSEGLKPAFPWLPLTILNSREFYDHHFLFHVGLIPFTFGDLRLGAKWASVVFASLAFLSIWWLLRNQRIPYAALWSLGLLAVSEAFIFRMSMTRVQSLSLAFLAFGLHFLLTGKHKRLIPLAFLYVWLYDAFPLILILTAAYVLSTWLIERRLDLRPLIYAGIGIGLGLLINPYFPDNVVFIYRHLAPKMTERTAVSVGNEWFPYRTTTLLENSPLAMVAFLGGVLALGLQDRRMDTRTATGFTLAVIFGLLLFQSRRFVEYFPAFALIFAALAWAPLLSGLAVGAGSGNDSTPRIGLLSRRKGLASAYKFRSPAIVLALILLPGMLLTLQDAQASLQGTSSYQRYAQASAWLKANTPAGARVFQTDWDDFPRLFYYNTYNTYLIGLDPTYMQLYNADLYDQWVEITEGKIDRPSEFISPRFGAHYVLTDLDHKNFIARAEKDSGLKQVYRDDEAIIYQISEP